MSDTTHPAAPGPLTAEPLTMTAADEAWLRQNTEGCYSVGPAWVNRYVRQSLREIDAQRAEVSRLTALLAEHEGDK